MGFDKWQDAVEAAVQSNQLQVKGEIGGGQLVQFTDASGAQMNMVSAEPFMVFAGFSGISRAYGDVKMLNDVLAACEVFDTSGMTLGTVYANLSQGPLLKEAGPQEFQALSFTVLGLSAQAYATSVDFENATSLVPGTLESRSAEGAERDAAVNFSGLVIESEYRTNLLTNQRFIHVTLDGDFPFDLCLPETALAELPKQGNVLAGTGVLTASILAFSGGGCGSSGGCGCGSGGCC